MLRLRFSLFVLVLVAAFVAVTAGKITSDTTTHTQHGTYLRAIRYEWSGNWGGVQDKYTANVPGRLVSWSDEHDCRVTSGTVGDSVVHIECRSGGGFDGSWGIIKLEYKRTSDL